MATLSPPFFVRIFLILAGNKDMHLSLGEFELRAHGTTDNRVVAKNTPLTYNGGNGVSTFSRLIFDPVLLIFID